MKQLIGIILGIVSFSSFAEIQSGSEVVLDCKDMPSKYTVLFMETLPGVGFKVKAETGAEQIIISNNCVITEVLPTATEAS